MMKDKWTNRTSKQRWFYTIVILLFLASVLFVNNNHSFYEHPIAQVVETTLVETEEITDMNDNKDVTYTQNIVAKMKSGTHKGELLHLANTYSASGAYDQPYKIGTELFVAIQKDEERTSPLTGTVKDVKRDKYILIVAWVFIFTLLFIGKKQGFFSIIGLAINATLLSLALDVYVHNAGSNLLLIACISAVLFTIISLVLLNGMNEKTYAAIIATIIGTFLSLLIAYVVIWGTGEKGLHYEEMQFLTRPYQPIFMAGLFLGSLGGVMDIAITMASSLFGLYEKDNHITTKTLHVSGREIGKDIMGTMTNILFFVYISGSIPMLILYLSNGAPLSFTFNINLSLEIARALAGGIGIVLAIPISLYTSIFFINRKRVKG